MISPSRQKFLAGVRIPYAAVAANPTRSLTSKPAPKAEFDLDDPEKVKALEKKYEHFTRPGSLYHKVAEGFAALSGVMSHPAFAEAGGVEPSRVQRDQADPATATRAATAEMSMKPQVKDLGAGGVRLTVNLPSVIIDVHGVLARPSPAQQLAYEAGRRLIRTLFPELDLEALEIVDGAAEPELSRELPIEAVASLNVQGIGKLDLSSWDKNYRNVVKYVLTAHSIRLYDDELPEKIGPHNDFKITVGVQAYVTFPREYALWCSSSTGADFVPTSFWMHQRRLQRWHSSTKPAGSPPPARAPHPDEPSRIRQDAANKYGLVPIPRVNKEDLCSNIRGELMYVPASGESSWTEVLRSCVDGATGDIDLGKTRGRHVASDWLLNKLLVTDDGGAQHVVDLTGCRPLTPVVIAHVASQRVGTMLSRVLQLADRLDGPIDSSVVKGAGAELRWENMIDVPFDEDEDAIINKRLFELGSRLSQAWTKLESSPLPLWEQLYTRPYMALFGPYYGKDARSKCVRALGERAALNRAAVPVDPDNVQLADMPGVDGMMPHQVEVDGALALFPHAAMLDVSAGGGKSLAYIDDITKLMNAGKIRRPGIAMPRNLMAPFGNEVVRFTHGHVRPFLINNKVWRAWVRRLGASPEAILQLLARQPKNTFFVVDYGWLSMSGIEVGFGDESATFYPNAHLMAQLKFDYFALDESQRAKKLRTGRTVAVSQLSSCAAVGDQGETEGYARIGSGTLFHNTARDIIGQMAQLEPTALGELGDEIADNNRVAISELPELRDRIGKFVRRIVVPRRKWAHLLPPVLERVWPVSMTKMQQKFYDDVMAETQERILQDPKIRKLLKQVKDGVNVTGSEARLEVLFKRYFAKLEIWLNAPDSDFAAKQLGVFFRNLSDIRPEDLKSPKIEMIDQLCDQHFNGGTADFGNGEVDVPPAKNKILIVGFNKAVSRHIYEHMKYKNRAVHYTAGDDAVLEAFKKNDVPILVADETSLSEGHNLQMCGRVIRTQTVWAPGMQEQTMARVWRPDVPDKDGNVRFERDHIFLDWIVVEPSLEVAKMARMIGKMVENGIAQEIDSNKNLAKIVQDNEEVFGAVKRVKMNLDMIRDKNLQTTDSLSTQFAAYQLFKGWERSEFAVERARLRKELEVKYGRKIKNAELGPLSMIRVTSTTTSEFDPGNRLQGMGYVPFVEGFTGWNTAGLNLAPISIPDPEDDEEDAPDDDAEVEDNIVVVKGDPVMTQYGPGTVVNPGRRLMLDVYVPGLRPSSIKLTKFTVLAAKDEVSKRALAKMLKAAPKGAPLLKVDEKSGSVQTVLGAVPATTVGNYIKAAASDIEAEEAEKARRDRATRDVTAPKAAGRPTPTAPKSRDVRERDVPVAKRTRVEEAPPSRDKRLAGITRAPGLRSDDPYAGRKKAPVAAPSKQKKPTAPISLSDKNLVKRAKDENTDKREASAAVLNGIMCIMTDDGGDRDPILLKNGFDRIGRSVRIRLKNPKAYRALLEFLSTKFVIPPKIKAQLDDFADIYATQRKNIAYMKARELPFHNMWVKDQRRKASEKREIRPWPVVEDGLVYLYINVETCPAANRLKQLSYPVGVVKPQQIEAGLVAMVKNRAQALDLLKRLEAKHVVFTNRDDLLRELKSIR